MSGFDTTWLTLREPADGRARDVPLLARFTAEVDGADQPVILDIGCGTGSTPRAIGPHLRHAAQWRLFDHDQRLLNAAKSRHGGEAAFEFAQGDLNQVAALPLQDAHFVTASALFDLCSGEFIDRFVAHIASLGTGLYAALNYDGRMQWSQAHDLDDAVVTRFNAHQRTDKGFGPSLGPDAWQRLADALSTAGYRVEIASSPWVLTASDADLQEMFLQGIADAVTEDGTLGRPQLAEWLAFRRDSIGTEGSSSLVGHQDVLAVR